MRRLALLALALTAACSDALEQTSSAGQVIGVVNASDRTLSVISATDFTVLTGTAKPMPMLPLCGLFGSSDRIWLVMPIT